MRNFIRLRMFHARTRRPFSRLIASVAAIAMLSTTAVPVWAGGVFSPNNLVVSRSVYTGSASTVAVGQTLPPGCVAQTVPVPLISPPPPLPATTPVKVTCAAAIANGVYPNVFNNNTVDGSFGVTSPIYLDQLTTAGAFLNSLAIDSTQIDTSFSSKSELALNKSLDGLSITFVGYVGGPGFTTAPNELDVSNSNTPGVVDPTNPVVSQYYRAVAEVDSSGDLQITDGNAYSGNNGRAAIKTSSASYYLTGNNNNGGLTVLKKSPFTNQLTQTQIGIDLITSTGAEFLVPGQTPPVPPNINQIGNFSVTPPDKPGKDNNFRGLTVFDNTLYVSKGSGGNGVNTVYQVGTAGTLPTPETAPGTPPSLLSEPIAILPGFPSTNASTATSFPFGLFFGDANTLYVCDEGDGVIADAAASTTAGLQKWSLVSGTWQMDYVLQNGLNLGVQYNVTPPGAAPYPNPATDGCRNLAGRVNTDGTVNLWAITSTVSASGDQGADPNKLVFITDKLAATTLPASEQFAELKTAQYGEVLRGVSFAPGAIASAPSSGNACNGVYNGTFQGTLTISAGQNCVFIGGTINGDVRLSGGNLSLTNTVVNGKVQAQNGGSFSIGPSVTINGNLQAHNLPAGGAGNQVCDSVITGNLQYQNSETPIEIGSSSPTCTGNTVGGNVQFHNNSAQGLISNNTINGNLQCQNNTPPASGIAGSNTVGGNKLGECNNL
jgi:hypothetical protein